MGKAKPARGAKAQREDRPSKRNPRVRIFSNSKSSSYEKLRKKIAKKFGGLEKSLYLCKVLNDKQQKEKK